MGSKVVVTRSKLDLLADSVSAKSGESLPLTIGEMKVAVDSIVLNSQIIGDGDLEVDENDYLYFDDDGGGGITPSGTINITTNGTHDVTNYASANVNVSGSVQTQTKSATPTESQQTITPDNGYYLSSVTVGAIDSGYVGTGVSRKSSTDLTVSGATITVPAGYYASQATKSVDSGTAGTPSATKGAVSNHSISVTPSVTNTTGYITGGTKTGTAVTVTASELVSGSETKTANGTYDVTNLAELVVNVSSGGGSSIASGTFTPAADTLSASFDIGDSSLTRFLIHALTSPYGNSKRVSALAYVDFENNKSFIVASNSAGSSSAGNYSFTSVLQGFSKSGSTVTISNSSAGTNRFNYFINGVTYQWYAW